jgi:hypothetical protein
LKSFRRQRRIGAAGHTPATVIGFRDIRCVATLQRLLENTHGEKGEGRQEKGRQEKESDRTQSERSTQAGSASQVGAEESKEGRQEKIGAEESKAARGEESGGAQTGRHEAASRTVGAGAGIDSGRVAVSDGGQFLAFVVSSGLRLRAARRMIAGPRAFNISWSKKCRECAGLNG